ncbi:MAG: ATP-binding cassette domain-containing protein [Sandaracinaceae bacterium]
MTGLLEEGIALRAEGLGRRFGSFRAVKDVSFEVHRGEIFGYLGANGAGKSTTIRMLCGLLAPSEGSAMVAGHDVASAPERVKAAIGYMSQRFSLYLDLPATHNLEFFGGAYGLSGRALRRRLDALVERTGLADHRDAITGSLPGGIRQRLALACALLHEPRIVFLDEPTAGVDPASRRDFWRLIRSLADAGTTVFVTTHYMDEAEYCARIGLMVAGELVALDSPQGLKARYAPGETVAIQGRGLHRGLDALRALADVASAEPFGASLQVRFRTRVDEQAIRRALEGVASVERIEPAEASLEDVFLAVVGEREKAA